MTTSWSIHGQPLAAPYWLKTDSLASKTNSLVFASLLSGFISSGSLVTNLRAWVVFLLGLNFYVLRKTKQNFEQAVLLFQLRHWYHYNYIEILYTIYQYYDQHLSYKYFDISINKICLPIFLYSHSFYHSLLSLNKLPAGCL